MAKALKEAKLNTSWVQPNEHWDCGDGGFRRAHSRSLAEAIVSSRASFPLAEEVARAGAINSLSQTLLKLTAPGRAGYLSGE